MISHSLRRVCGAAVAAAIVLAGTVAAPRAHADNQAAYPMTITGSTQMYTLGELLAKEYMRTHTGLTITVNPTNGQSGYTDTCTGGNSNLGMSDIYIQAIEETNCTGMLNIPVAISSVAAVYNIPGSYFNNRLSDGFTLVHPINLSAQVVADIYLCKVKKWNDPEIARINRGMALPSQRIQLFAMSEPAGSGFVYDQWLAASDPEWNQKVGVGLQPQWPACSTLLPSSGIMAQEIAATPYSLGFAGFDYAISSKLQAAALQNASGYFVPPSINGMASTITSAIHAGMPVNFVKSFVASRDPQPGWLPAGTKFAHAYDPSCFEFWLIPANLIAHSYRPGFAQAVKSFLGWTVDEKGGQAYIGLIEFRKVGNKDVLSHGFLPVPTELLQATTNLVNSIKAS